MSRPSTSRDVQRVTFVESLHNSLKKQATKALAEQKKFISIASSYVNDGLEESECIELLMIDGLSREAAESYTAMAMNKESEARNELSEYSFQFEDVDGKILSSYDIGKTIKASNEEEAWAQAEAFLYDESDVEPHKLLNIHRID